MLQLKLGLFQNRKFDWAFEFIFRCGEKLFNLYFAYFCRKIDGRQNCKAQQKGNLFQ